MSLRLSAIAPWSEGGRMSLPTIVTSGRDEGGRSGPTQCLNFILATTFFPALLFAPPDEL